MSTLKMILSVGSQYKYYFKQLNVLKLNKALYGFKQIFKSWNNKKERK